MPVFVILCYINTVEFKLIELNFLIMYFQTSCRSMLAPYRGAPADQHGQTQKNLTLIKFGGHLPLHLCTAFSADAIFRLLFKCFANYLHISTGRMRWTCESLM